MNADGTLGNRVSRRKPIQLSQNFVGVVAVINHVILATLQLPTNYGR